MVSRIGPVPSRRWVSTMVWVASRMFKTRSPAPLAYSHNRLRVSSNPTSIARLLPRTTSLRSHSTGISQTVSSSLRPLSRRVAALSGPPPADVCNADSVILRCASDDPSISGLAVR